MYNIIITKCHNAQHFDVLDNKNRAIPFWTPCIYGYHRTKSGDSPAPDFIWTRFAGLN